MKEQLKLKHIFSLLSAVIFFGLIALHLNNFLGWFIPSFSFLIVSAILAALGSIGFFYYVAGKRNESLMLKLGVSGMFGIFIIPAVFGLSTLLASVLGTPQQEKGSVVAYSWSSRHCGYRLVTNELTPIGGGFCNAGKDESRFKNIDTVNIKIKVTALGILVTHIVPANQSFKRDD